MTLEEVKSKIEDCISDHVEITDVPYSRIENDKHIDPRTIEHAAEHILAMLISNGLLR
jgi:hypothetical protein